MGVIHTPTLPGHNEIPPKKVFREFWADAKPYRRSLLFMVLFMILQGGIVGGSIWLIKSSIDCFFEQKDMSAAFFLIGSLFVATVGKSVTEFFFQWNRTIITSRMRDAMVVKSFRDLVYNPFSLHISERDRKKYGWVLTDAMNYTGAVFGMFNSWVKQPFMVVSTLGALFFIAPLFTGLGILLIPLLIPCLLFMKRKIKKFIAKREQFIGMVEEVVADSIRGIRIVKVFGLEENEIKKIKKIIDLQRELVIKNAFYTGLLSPLSELIGLLGLSVIILLGSRYIHTGAFTTGTFLVFIMSFLNIYRPLKQISNGMLNYHMALDAGRRLIILRQNAIKEQKRKGTIKLGTVANIRIENLWFSYLNTKENEKEERKNSDYVLRGLDLAVKKGDSVALTGVTGSGKSTLCDLIFKLYQPDRGNIYINDIAIEDVEDNSFREKFALCSQETIVFNNSLLEDIRIARPDASREDVLAVAKAAGMSSFLNSLDCGLDTWIGDRGVHCSGGQRQMIALARTLLQKPEIMVLDEAISGIDLETGRKIWQNIREMLPECTIIMVSHHLHIIQRCQRVIVLEEGRIVQDISVGKVRNLSEFLRQYHPQTEQNGGEVL